MERSGRAALCVPHAAWFQGYFVCARTRRQLGLLGEQLPVDDCVRCSHGGYAEYRLTVLDYESGKEASVHVRKTGGDLCQLDSDELSFTPEVLLTDDKAREAVASYFPSIAERTADDPDALEDCVVAFGAMKIARLEFV